MRHLLATLAAVALCAPIATTTYSQGTEGINLSWDDCGTFGTANKTFACNTNDGFDVLVASFVVPYDLPQFQGVICFVDIRSASPQIPDWWKFTSGRASDIGGCRDSMAGDVNSNSCPSPYANAVNDLNVGRQHTYNPEVIRVLGIAAQLIAAPLVGGPVEYTAFRFILHRDRTIGTGSCAGCAETVCIVLNEVQLIQRLQEGNDPSVTMPFVRSHVTWQESVPSCPASTTSRKTTWGLLKSIYR